MNIRKRQYLIRAVLMDTLNAMASVAQAASPLSASTSKRPNSIIPGDHLGFSDIGAFGSEIKIPNLDSLAKNVLSGLRNLF
jgi:hypothetical protein